MNTIVRFFWHTVFAYAHALILMIPILNVFMYRVIVNNAVKANHERYEEFMKQNEPLNEIKKRLKV